MKYGNRATDIKPEEWTNHSGFNAYRYGADDYELMTPTMPTWQEVEEYLEWEKHWSDMGVPG